MEAFVKAVTGGIEKPAGEFKPRELPPEIAKAPGPDFKPPWKYELGNLEKSKTAHESRPWEEGKTPDISDVNKTVQTFEPPWKGTVELPVNSFVNRNKDLEGKKHPETEVPFERKTVKDGEGNDVEGIFPVFDSQFDAQLPENLYKASDKEQFGECNKQLKAAIEKNPEIAKKFTPEQLEQIKNGDTPDGCTWHHNEETGKIQLVDSEIHAKTGHTGGRVIWGGGNENR